jgi:ATP-binding cassette subfamily F protein uup
MVRGRPKHVVGYLKEFLFSENQARGPVSALSGGEKARLLLAKIMAKESNLLILDEPTNDLDVETLDLLQELLDDYPGTVILVSHDRDFLDRVATTTIALGKGRATIYAGGYSDYIAQRGDVEKPVERVKAPQKKAEAAPKSPAKVNTQKIERLEREMERLSTEIAKLESFLADPELFQKEPSKFQKASDGLLERQSMLEAVEEELLALSEQAS